MESSKKDAVTFPSDRVSAVIALQGASQGVLKELPSEETRCRVQSEYRSCEAVPCFVLIIQ